MPVGVGVADGAAFGMLVAVDVVVVEMMERVASANSAPLADVATIRCAPGMAAGAVNDAENRPPRSVRG
jgi:hypothetical protein